MMRRGAERTELLRLTLTASALRSNRDCPSVPCRASVPAVRGRSPGHELDPGSGRQAGRTRMHGKGSREGGVVGVSSSRPELTSRA